jgi:hypothetical protein
MNKLFCNFRFKNYNNVKVTSISSSLFSTQMHEGRRNNMKFPIPFDHSGNLIFSLFCLQIPMLYKSNDKIATEVASSQNTNPEI